METDLELLNSARALNKEALIKIFDLYSPALYNYALRLCGDPVTADQIVGDVFAILLDQFSRGEGPTANLRSYLFQTVHHRLIDQARSSRHVAPLETVDWLHPDVNAAHMSLENRLLFKQTLQAIQKYLTKDQRHVIILRLLEGFSVQETAAITGKKVGHVKVIQNRAIAALRRALGQNLIKKVVPSSSEINEYPKAQ
jgi:RNA polymerase sigma-70 factor (ECF subfamily)